LKNWLYNHKEELLEPKMLLKITDMNLKIKYISLLLCFKEK